MGRLGAPLALCLLAAAAVGALADSTLDLPVARPDGGTSSTSSPPFPLPPVGPLPEVVEPPSIYGESLPAVRSVAYVVDESSSMTIQRWTKLQAEVQASVGRLESSIQFNLLAFSNSTTPWADNLRTALPGNKASAQAWLAARSPWGGTNTAPAVIAAASLGVDLVVLLTDGRPGQAGVPRGVAPEQWHAEQIVRNVDCPVWVFGLDVDERGRWFGHAVASGTGGMYVEP